MNKKGQALVLFIIFIPILVLSFALIVDVGLMYKSKIKGEELLKTSISENRNIKDYFELNDLKISNIEGEKCKKVTIEINSVFGSIIGIKKYYVEVDNC